jgi:hypothetical protein
MRRRDRYAMRNKMLYCREYAPSSQKSNLLGLNMVLAASDAAQAALQTLAVAPSNTGSVGFRSLNMSQALGMAVARSHLSARLVLVNGVGTLGGTVVVLRRVSTCVMLK